jgi:hypothetical protein
MRRLLVSSLAVVSLLVVGSCSNSQPSPTTPTAQSATPTTPAPAPPTSGFRLTVTVTDKTGRPFSGDATITIVNGPYAGQSKTATNGVVVFTDLSRSSFLVQATSPGHPAGIERVQVIADTSISIPLEYDTITLTGLVTSAETSAPLAGVTIYLNGRYRTTTDGSGRYSLDGILDLGSLASGTNIAWTVTDGYDADIHDVSSSSLDFQLHRTQRFTAGAAVEVTVVPTDSVCSNDTQEPGWGQDNYACREIHTTAPADGAINIETVSRSGDHFPLVAQSATHGCCGLNNPTTFNVKAGDDIDIFVELPVTSAMSQTFVVTASMVDGSAPINRKR